MTPLQPESHFTSVALRSRLVMLAAALLTFIWVPAARASSSLVLAQDSTWSIRGMFERLDFLSKPQELIQSLAKMPMVVAAVIVVMGVLCVLNGYRWHRWVVVVLSLMLGLYLGYELSFQMGRSIVVAGALGLLFAIVATPMQKLAVAVFGGITGAFLGANIWTLAKATPVDAQWAGACMGFIVMAMASFVLFRLVIVGFTSIGGAAMVVLGAIALLMQVPGWDGPITSSLTTNKYMIPLLVTTAAVGGFVLQQSSARAASPEKKAA